MAESELHKLIKTAIAKELFKYGYEVGMEVRQPEGIVDVQAKRGLETINIEVWQTHIPEWIIVKVKDKVETRKPKPAHREYIYNGPERFGNLDDAYQAGLLR